jgi:predicted AAA+ superfamily ATPase
MKSVKKYYNRLIDKTLENWKDSSDRKPLLLRGARQVGKSTAVRQLAKEFSYFLEINFEEQPQIQELFKQNLTAIQLCENLSILTGISIVAGQTLIFFDEIQSCIPAISSLRFFYEQMPELHVIAAGSLLEFAIQELPSYGVGRVRSAFMYPFSFDEFLMALNETALLQLKQKADYDNPLPSIFHNKLVDYLKKFLIIGGMPEVVSKYVQNHNINEIQYVLDDLLISFRADFTKYKKKVPSNRILEVFESVSQQSGGKFVFKKAAVESNQKQVKEAVELLIMAGLVIPVTHTSANGIPLGAESDSKKRKLFIFDTGLFQRICGLNLSQIIIETDFNIINKGAIAEQFSGLEFLKYTDPFHQLNLYYWHRETASSNAEVDFLIQNQTEIIPVEIKSSGQGSMQSMYQFLNEKNRKRGVRFSLENFSKVNGIDIYPLYAISNFIQRINQII